MKTLAKTIAYFCVGVICCRFVAKFVADDLWWFGLPFAQQLLLYFENRAARGSRLYNELGPERVRLNFEMAQRKEPVLLPARALYFLFVASFLSLSFFGLQDDIRLNMGRLAHLFEREEPMLRVEYASYSEKHAADFSIAKQKDPILVDSACYLNFTVRHKESGTHWSIRINDTEGALTSMDAELSSSGAWAAAVTSLYEKLQLTKDSEHTLLATLTRNGGDSYPVTLRVSPLPKPQVDIEALTATTDEIRTADVGKLKFRVGAQSEVPLQNVELAIRTESGYRFNKTLAEFANNNETNFDSDNADVVTSSIPFGEKDVLYVKAIAKTVVPGLIGESKELSFKVQSRQEIRANVMKLTQDALELFKKNEGNFAETQKQILDTLNEASQAASQLGLRSPTKRRLEDARALAQSMETLKDRNAKEAQEKLQSILQSGKREQSLENLSNLYARLQSLKQAIARSPENELGKLSNDASKLGGEAGKLKKEMEGVINMPDSGLTLEEKQAAQRMLQLDKTDSYLNDLTHQLQKGNKVESDSAAAKSLEELQSHLGSAAQILMQARSRAIRAARESLSQADQKMESAREQNKQEGSKSIQEGQKQLDSLPRLGKEFDSAANDAREGANDAKKADNPKHRVQALDKAQDGIARALAALQDEEQSERNAEKDYEEKENAMETLAAQGQYDVGWRKKILDEIARLRATGEASDSPLIRYLESRLR